ncbi:MAG: hypothetical protein WBP22_01765 [Candidatus Saccharimonas sp.]
MSRERQQIYYLEQVAGGRHLLAEDGSLTTLRTKETIVEERLPSRVPGRERIVPTRRTVLARAAVFASAQEYLQQHPNKLWQSPYGEGWTLEDMPSDVLSAYEAWDAEPLPVTHDELVTAARELASEAVDHDSTINCRQCPQDAKYWCYITGRTRQVYQYPMIEVEADGERVLQPFDVAEIIANNPAALTLSTEVNLDFGKLAAFKQLAIDLTQLPIADGRVGRVAAADKIKTARIVLDQWSEPGRYDANQVVSARSPRGYLRKLQRAVAEDQRSLERADDTDYDASLGRLLSEAGRRGMYLAFESTSNFGDPSWELDYTNEQAYFEPVVHVASGFPLREAILKATGELEY